MKTTRFFSSLALAGCLTLSCSTAFANMLISPLRVLLTEDSRTATITLRNTGAGPRTYRLSWIPKQMKETGGYEPTVDESRIPPPAADMIRFSPQQITVPAEENQTIRLSLRPPPNFKPGEYRSHLKLSVLPDVSEPITTLNAGQENGIRMELDMQMSFVMPVVVRKGVAPPSVNISKIEVLPANEEKPLRLAITLDRDGDSSSFGDVVVEYQTDRSSPVKLIGRQGDVSIFTEIKRRIVTIPLGTNRIPAGSFVRVAYVGAQEYSGKIWDEEVFQAR